MGCMMSWYLTGSFPLSIWTDKSGAIPSNIYTELYGVRWIHVIYGWNNQYCGTER